MDNLGEIIKKHKSQIDNLDLEIIISYVIVKSREFVISHSEFIPSKTQEAKIKRLILKRQEGFPSAYLMGEKGFFGLDFKVDKNVLIPRPETEILVEEALELLKTEYYQLETVRIIDVGTGSGNIVISIAHNIKHVTYNKKVSYFATDISSPALKIAKLNSRKYKLDKKIKFFKGYLLKPLIGICHLLGGVPTWREKLEIGNSRIIILANLPYVSSKNYKKYYSGIKFEPQTALVSKNCGLFHYEKLFQQIKTLLLTVHCSLLTVLIEFSPEQKNKIKLLAKIYFPTSKIEFKKDLAKKWRMGKITF